jgi:hypothetical protein
VGLGLLKEFQKYETTKSNVTEIFSENNDTCVCKAKAIPLHALTGPEGSSRLRLPDFKTIGT